MTEQQKENLNVALLFLSKVINRAELKDLYKRIVR